MATKTIETEPNLNVEKLRFDQLGETVDAFMERLPVGDVALQMALWDTRRTQKGHAAFLANDATGLKRLNDECAVALDRMARTRFGR